MSYTLHRPTPHEVIVRREPFAAMPGFRAVCSCGEECWRSSEDRIAEWEHRHANLRGSVA